MESYLCDVVGSSSDEAEVNKLLPLLYHGTPCFEKTFVATALKPS